MIAIHLVESVGKRAPRAFNRKTFAPAFAIERPTQFESGPADGIHEPDPSDQALGLLFFNRPDSVAAKIPVTHVGSHIPPRLYFSHRTAAEKAHDFGIRTDFRVLRKIGFAEETKQQPLSFQGDFLQMNLPPGNGRSNGRSR